MKQFQSIIESNCFYLISGQTKLQLNFAFSPDDDRGNVGSERRRGRLRRSKNDQLGKGIPRGSCRIF